MTTQAQIIRLGIVGLGAAGAGMVAPAMGAMTNFSLAAAADTNRRTLNVFGEKYGVRTYDSIEALCGDPEVDAVWIATPNTFHCQHTILAASHGKHVVVEKPMAITLAEAQQMIDACDANNVQLVCGGSKSSSPVVRKMRDTLRSGELGPLRAMTTWSATDWMLRPRRPDELDVSRGGGVVYRQAPHQVDTLRLLAGGLVHRVRAMTGQWLPRRDSAPGYFTAQLEFKDGTPATLIYSSSGYFMGSEFFEPAAGVGPATPGTDRRISTRIEVTTGTRDDAAAKEERTLSASTGGARAAVDGQRSTFLSDLGLLVVSCERGDMRQSPAGIYVYGDEGTREERVDEDRRSFLPELVELQEALTEGKPLLHSGRWGLATLEVCLAIMQSAREGCELFMKQQVSVPDGV